jgi:hypothetical protein
LRIEEYLCFSGFELTADCGTFTGQIDFPVPIVGAFTQHETFDDSFESGRRELIRRYTQRFILAFVIAGCPEPGLSDGLRSPARTVSLYL